VIDSNGRVFGRFNLVDAAAIALVPLLILAGYATYLLFRPARPAIDSVTRVEVTKEERRVAGGSLLTAKLKVRGSGFTPLLRARIGGQEALGFVFENPNSADVLVGLVPQGRHDLVLYDGVQEVARAREAVDIQATAGTSVRAYGWLTLLAKSDADALKAGFASDPQAPGAFQVLAAGDARPARSRIRLGESVADLPVEHRFERPAEVLIRCDWPSVYTCTIAGEALTQSPPITVTLPGGYTFQIEEIAPAAAPRRATVRLQLSGVSNGMRVGDRDEVAGARAAEIASIAGSVITVRAGVDDSREGWRYRGQLLSPGSRGTLKTDRYVAAGTVIDVALEPEVKP